MIAHFGFLRLRPRPDGVVTIGTYDGVHRGHQAVLRQTAREARARGTEAVAVTFDPHPRCVLDPDRCPPSLTTVDEKLLLLREAGIDRTLVVKFTPAVARLTPEGFMRRLEGAIAIRHMVEGYDFAFGRNRSGDRRFLTRYGARAGFRVTTVAPQRLGTAAISSSRIRRLLLAGQLAQANRRLGHAYFMLGSVEHGFQVGTRIGFPTANLRLTPNKLVPLRGVYAVRIGLAERWYRGALNIGYRPTFGGDKQTVEAFVLDFQGDLYHEAVRVDLVARLRDERKFETVNALIRQIGRDVERVRQVLAAPSARP